MKKDSNCWMRSGIVSSPTNSVSGEREWQNSIHELVNYILYLYVYIIDDKEWVHESDRWRARALHPRQLVGTLRLHSACYFVQIIMAVHHQSRSFRKTFNFCYNYAIHDSWSWYILSPSHSTSICFSL